MPTFGSLFAGIGGIDLGLERAGWTCRWQVEWDAYCQRVLAKHWPDVPRYGDITAVDWTGVERVDLLAGGFPCQPVSDAGAKRAQEDARWLWPEFYRAIRALRPRLVLVENVSGLRARGMGDVLGDLAESGYDAEWDSVPAAAVGAVHIRDRVWIIAHADRLEHESDAPSLRRTPAPFLLADDDRHDRGASGPGSAQARTAGHPLDGGPSDAAVPALAHADDGGWHGRPRFFGEGWRRQLADSRGWATEPDVGRVAHGVPARVDRLRALGNAVVPQVVQVIGEELIHAYRD